VKKSRKRTEEVARTEHVPTRESIAAAADHRPARSSVSWRYTRTAPKKNSVNMCRADHLLNNVEGEMMVLYIISICRNAQVAK
jgi:hypothetical protein